MADPKKELEEVQKGVEKAQDAVRASLIGLFTSAQEVLKLLEQFHKLSREQLSDLSQGLNYLNERYYNANKNIRLVQEKAALTQGKTVSPLSAKTNQFLAQSNDKFNQVNDVIGKINKAISKIPLEHGKVPPEVDVGVLKAQGKSLNNQLNEYNLISEKLKQAQKQGKAPQAKEQGPSIRKPGH